MAVVKLHGVDALGFHSSLANLTCKFFTVTLSEAKGPGLGGTPTPDASPLRLAQHDIFSLEGVRLLMPDTTYTRD